MRPSEKDRSGSLSLGFVVLVLAPQRAGSFLEVVQDGDPLPNRDLETLRGLVTLYGIGHYKSVTREVEGGRRQICRRLQCTGLCRS